MTGHNTISQSNFKYSYYSRNLPHLFDIDKPIFITYRLKFTLPKAISEELNQRKTQWFAELQNLDDIEKEQRMLGKDAVFFGWFDELIASSAEVPQILHRPDLAEIIVKSFISYDHKHYELLAYCIMLNHVHVLILPSRQPEGEIYPPSHITYTWKRYTANQINAALNRKGSLWQQESYDHLVMDEPKLNRVLDYIVQNPIMAGLTDRWDKWQYTWIRDDLRPGV
jgi:REP element-mobilizing transposase RayT